MVTANRHPIQQYLDLRGQLSLLHLKCDPRLPHPSLLLEKRDLVFRPFKLIVQRHKTSVLGSRGVLVALKLDPDILRKSSLPNRGHHL